MRPATDLAVLETWFERALATPPPDRDGILAEVPPHLREILAQMLGAVSDAQAALEAPRWSLRDLDPDDRRPPSSHGALSLAPGTRAGPFTIRELIGRGGMGAVYRAEQDRPRREVAIKVLATPLLSDRARRRFDREAEVLARLNHPGIVPIYEAGVLGDAHSGTPYFVMELVKGVPLGEWIRAQSGGGPPTLSQRLDLAAQICDAVEHAHQRSVLHRDLKPANIIVGEDGRPHVLDFGVARLLSPDHDAAANTLDLDLAGTLAYMSPEQLLSGITDTRSDVYALGLICWEVIVGSYPFGSAPRSLEDAMSIARGLKPTPAVPARLPRDVRLVLLKAIARDPDLRYRGAGELADDLRRLHAGLPVHARQVTPLYVLSRWVARHPWQAGLVGTLILASATLAVWATASNIKAQREYHQRLRAVDLAKKRLDSQREFIMQSLVRTAHVLQGLPAGRHAHAQLLRDAVPRLEALAADAGDDLDLLCDLSDAMVSLAQSAGGLGTPNTGEHDLAEQLNARAMAMAEAAVQLAPNSSKPLRSLERAVLGAASLPSGVPHREALFTRSVHLKRRIYEMDGRRDEDAFRLAYSLQIFGSFAGDHAMIQEAVDLFSNLMSREPDHWEYKVATGTAMRVLAREFADSNPARAFDLSSRAEAMLASAHDANPDSYSCTRHLVFTRVTLAHSLVNLQRYPEARSSFDAAFGTLEANFNDPGNTVHVADRVVTCTNAMLAIRIALQASSLDAAERRSMLEIGLRAHALLRLRPPSADPELPENIRLALHDADEAASQWRAELAASSGS
jgi:tRNA A-37 threonylcarbamoyl transferase component Bud32